MERVDPVNATFAHGALSLRAAGWILDDDSLGNKRAMFVSDAVVTETDSSAATARFEVSLSSPLTTDASFDRTVAGSAQAGVDYVPKTGTVNLLAGQTSAIVSVSVRGDKIIEGAESFFLQVDPTPEIASGPIGSVGRATILDNDTRSGPTISVEGGNGPESDDLPFIVRLSAPSSEAITVDYRAISGTAQSGASQDFYGLDYYGTRTLTFNPGETTKAVGVMRSDSVVEFDESVVFELVDPINASFRGDVKTLRATGWILDDDSVANKRAVFISKSTTGGRTRSGATEAVFDVSLSRASSERITLDYKTANLTAIAGRDYKARSGSIVFLPGQTETSVRVPILSDYSQEGTETFILRIVPPFPVQFPSGSAAALGTASILDSTIRGSNLSETLVGDDENDAIFGLGGNDYIYGFGGRDRLYGGAGDDLLYGGRDADRMDGGRGDDVFVVDDRGDVVVEARGEGRDLVRSSVSYKLGVNVENLTLTGSQKINGVGNGLDNTIRGNGNANTLTGDDGNDRLYGGAGKDVLIGGLGSDQMTGGDDADRFVFLKIRESQPGHARDTILDFTGQDEIDLSGIDANTARAGNQTFKYIGSAAFSDTAGELRFHKEVLEADVTGDGRADFRIELEDVAGLSVNDLDL